MKLYKIKSIKTQTYCSGGKGRWNSNEDSGKVYGRKCDVIKAIKYLKSEMSISSLVVEEYEVILKNEFSAIDFIKI